MKIKYAFLDGTVTEVEVSDEIGVVIIDSRKAEHAQDERHRYHCYSYDAIDYEGEEYGACDEYAVEDDSAEQSARIQEAFSHLTATQQRQKKVFENFPPDTLTNPRFFWVHRKATKYEPSGKDGNPI